MKKITHLQKMGIAYAEFSKISDSKSTIEKAENKVIANVETLRCKNKMLNDRITNLKD